MKAIKRTVAGLLATLMLATSFSFTSFTADNYTDEEAVAVSKVNAASIMTGTEKGFEPSKTLTRAEAAAIVVRMKGVPESQVNGAKGNTLFTDVPASNWAAGYINAASSMGIISGVGNGLFLPEREVTIVEFAAMAIRALGAGKLVDTIGTWPTNYVNFATEEKLFDGVLKVYTAPATRMDVAFMVVNTIEANVWEKTEVTNTNEVTYKKQEDKTILGSVLEITVKENQVVNSLDTKDREVTFNSGVFGNYEVAEGVELATLKAGMEVDVWAKVDDKEIIRIAPAEKSKQTTVAFAGIDKIDVETGKVTLLVDGKAKKYAVDAAKLAVSFNTLEDPSDAQITTDAIAATVVTVEDDPDTDEDETEYGIGDTILVPSEDIFGTVILEGNKITTIYAEAYDTKAVVKEIKKDTLYFDTKIEERSNVSKLKLDTEEKEYIVTKNGKEIDVTDIEEGDALYYYEDTNDSDRLVMVVNNATVEGKAKEVSAKYVKVDGKKYAASPSITGTLDVTAGDEVKLYLNARGEITMYDIIDGSVDSTVAMVKSVRTKDGEYQDEDIRVEMTLVALDGTELDAKYVDLKVSVEKINEQNEDEYVDVEDDPDTDDVDETKSAEEALADDLAGLKGTLVRYTLKGTKIVVREFDNSGILSAYEEPKIVYFDDADYNEKAKVLVDQDTDDEYFVTEDTVIYVVKPATEDYAVKFEKVEVKSLGKSEELSGYLYGVDEDTNEVDAILFKDSEDVKRATEKDYAFVLYADTNYSNEDEEDYTAKVTLLYNDGTTEEVLVHSDDASAITQLKVIEAFVEDGKLKDYNDVDFDTVDAGIYDFQGERVKLMTDSGDDDVADPVKNVTIVEDCIFVAHDTTPKKLPLEYTAGEESDVREIANSVDEYDDIEADDVVVVYTVVNEETDRPEIVAVVYVVEE